MCWFINVNIGWGGYKLLKHIKKIDNLIINLKSTVAILSAQLDKFDNVVEWDAGGYNYLAIGNSITLHEKAEYWWQNCGMAASTADKDYFHIVSDYLRSTHNDVAANCFNGYVWEIQNHDRSEVLSTGVWDGYLSEKLNLVTIQLSENCSDVETFEGDFREMVEYVRLKCSKAQIIVIDDFWSNKKSIMKKKSASELNVDFVDLSEIRGKREYQAGIGAVVYDSDGNEHVVAHKGVASHPGDKGMKYYADKIIEKLQA